VAYVAFECHALPLSVDEFHLSTFSRCDEKGSQEIKESTSDLEALPNRFRVEKGMFGEKARIGFRRFLPLYIAEPQAGSHSKTRKFEIQKEKSCFHVDQHK
jgi:hypothetical protein